MAPPFALTGIDHIVFLVDDMPKALRWYREVLGCEVGFSYPALGMEQVWAGNALIVLWDITSEGGKKAGEQATGGRNVDHVCLSTGPFDHDAMRTHLTAQGVTVEREGFHGGARGQSNSFYIRDPFGNLLEIKGPPVYPDGRAT